MTKRTGRISKEKKRFYEKTFVFNKISEWIINNVEKERQKEEGENYCPLVGTERDQVKMQVDLFLIFGIFIFFIIVAAMILVFLFMYFLN